MRRGPVLLLLLMVLLVAVDLAAKTIDYDALERQWEKGDMDEELLSDEALAAKQNRKQELEKSEMVFVTLEPSAVAAFAMAHPDYEKPLSELCALWKSMLLNGGLDVNFYELEGAKVLAGLQRGSRVQELHAFLFEQPQVTEIQWNQETLYPPRAKNRKPKKAKKATKAKPTSPKTEL
ncbi:hypothetical protein SDRG_04619 [Saprolegnia diclina VS20]|uniref:Uncharacterized protein n=1 Tax=Saprolegnia diclina (strain VS20) TaxID=1156394 RepID=T0QVX3_SAPDV|nr:hypothetical protein SDRG_04619 [Saprolegnia diclina VS20]EQC38190.1 hypothetical protein SDRG_04619 [Saprolegnia diclina VS20]|eukprot:XP_008608517.1 hypothetical protein SDRG_04619 [Saprolegnia diclina VS20]